MTKATCKIKLNIMVKRFMHRTTAFISKLPNTSRGSLDIMRPDSTKNVYQLKGKAKQMANDNTGKHSHVTEEKCIEVDCESKKCMTLCNKPFGFCIIGHNTHKPPVGRMARFIDEHDAKGDPKSQYFIPVNTKKEISEVEKQQYGNDIKQDLKKKNYVDIHSDKYE